MKKLMKRAILILVLLVLGGVGFVAALRHYVASQYPYGSSHCCDLGLMMSLDRYAKDHEGFFPAGEATPEASLSLLYAKYETDAQILRGKSVPEGKVQAVLDKGELLGPDTCGWHYVEGLRQGDDPELAIFWDKAGLDHNGRLLTGGGHIVMFLNLQRAQVPATEWENFLAQQQKLFLAAQATRQKTD